MTGAAGRRLRFSTRCTWRRLLPRRRHVRWTPAPTGSTRRARNHLRERPTAIRAGGGETRGPGPCVLLAWGRSRAARGSTHPGETVQERGAGKMAESDRLEAGVEAREGQQDWEGFEARFRSIQDNIEKVVQGKPREVRLALVALVAEGHLLIEDVPGVGKTLLAKALARSIDCSFRRIQFTPDLLPTDVTGVNVFNQERGDFEFKPGAIFANIVLADEINRASPKTQSALLECMEERQVTVDTETYQLGTPFIVIATQNPVEHEGTYPLPEAQLDRFMMR